MYRSGVVPRNGNQSLWGHLSNPYAVNLKCFTLKKFVNSSKFDKRKKVLSIIPTSLYETRFFHRTNMAFCLTDPARLTRLIDLVDLVHLNFARAFEFARYQFLLAKLIFFGVDDVVS